MGEIILSFLPVINNFLVLFIGLFIYEVIERFDKTSYKKNDIKDIFSSPWKRWIFNVITVIAAIILTGFFIYLIFKTLLLYFESENFSYFGSIQIIYLLTFIIITVLHIFLSKISIAQNKITIAIFYPIILVFFLLFLNR